MKTNTYFISDISNNQFLTSEKINGDNIPAPMLEFLKKQNPNITENSVLSISELKEIKKEYIKDYMVSHIDDFSKDEQKVLESINNKSTISDYKENNNTNLTWGQKIADKVADFGGSWNFILIFISFIVLWIIINSLTLIFKPFDTYPYILLNLILSCVAALQAPVIMMSQNRQEDKDRERAKQDYMVNLKAEIEIKTLHEKLDHLMYHQQQNMLEVQKIQIDLLTELLDEINTQFAHSKKSNQ